MSRGLVLVKPRRGGADCIQGVIAVPTDWHARGTCASNGMVFGQETGQKEAAGVKCENGVERQLCEQKQ